mmetsp:Transcript_17589/g.15502  ORF Transcript_17589/g.15502 Transcript_17589/m.15502 type:complete len:131 (+) Transcript_17589:217-609(+)
MEDSLDHTYYGLRDGPEMKSYKVGLHEKRDFKVILEYFKDRFNSNLSCDEGSDKINIKNAKPCFYSFGKNNNFCYSKGSSGVHYCYGFTGTGFKFLPLHGKIMYSLVTKTDIGFEHPALGNYTVPKRAKM